MKSSTLGFLLAALAASSHAARAQEPADLTVRERFWQLFMLPGSLDDSTHDYSHGVFGLQVPPAATARADAERINAIQRYFVERTRARIPMIAFEEAVHGLRRPGATMFPQAIALAATWDTALIGRAAAAMAREARSRGIRMVLSPVVNIASDARWGRVEETYGEDPHLSSAMARAYVTAFERAGVITTPKHFVANVGDGGRDSWPINLDDRTLGEVHYPPFRAAIDAGAGSVMTAYNAVGGIPATQNRRLLTDELRTRWGFTGFVISDASATGGPTVLQLTEPNTPAAAASAFRAGLDVVFQSSWPEHRPYLAAFEQQLVPRAAADSALARVLRAKRRLGLFEQPYADPDSAAHWNGHASHLALAREAAAASIVLLKNVGPQPPLPIGRSGGRPIALIGVDGSELRFGGYSDRGVAPVSILDALRERVGARVRFEPGPGRDSASVVTVPAGRLALTTTFYDNPRFDGEPVATRQDSAIDNRWTFNRPARGLDTDWYSIRWEGTISAGAEPVRRLGIEGSDGWRLWLDGRLLLDNWQKQSYRTLLADVNLQPGSRHAIRVEYRETTGNARIRLVWDGGVRRDRRDAIARAVALARASSVAVVVAGIEEGEFRDRAFLGLPGLQEQLIREVAATGTPTVVVLIGGSAITMPWLDAADAVLMAWYPGEAGGRALADVLFGDGNPSGRLPITFPVTEGQLPLVYNHHPTGRGNDYLDLSGQPLFPFGFGLSYTTFEYSDLRIARDSVRFRVHNRGTRAGHEVAQLYVRDLLASVTRPVQSLAGFARIRLEPGDVREVALPLDSRQLGLLNQQGEWVVEPGAFRVWVGSSSQDIRLRGELVVR